MLEKRLLRSPKSMDDRMGAIFTKSIRIESQRTLIQEGIEPAEIIIINAYNGLPDKIKAELAILWDLLVE